MKPIDIFSLGQRSYEQRAMGGFFDTDAGNCQCYSILVSLPIYQPPFLMIDLGIQSTIERDYAHDL